MPFPIPSLSETRDFLLAVGKALFNDRNYDNLRSYHSKRATFAAAAATQLHAHADQAQKDVHPLTAPDGQPINDWGEATGVDRKTATAARKAAAGRVTGANGTAIPVDSELLHDSGMRFKISAATVIPAALFIDADIAGITTGVRTRLLKGATLRFVATPPGADTEVVLQRDLDEDGFDAEQFGPYRRRVLDAIGIPPSGGTKDDFRKWGLELTGVDQVYVYPSRAGLGTVDIVGTHSASGVARELTGGEAAELLAYIKTKAPAHLSGEALIFSIFTPLRHLDIIPDTQNVEMLLTTNGEAAFAFDWTGGPLAVLAWTGATRTLQFNGNRPSSMKAGHRIILVGVASVQDGREYKIEALSGVDSVILEVAPANNPAATDIVYSGGPLVTPIRDAVLAHMNGEYVYAGPDRTPIAEAALDSTVGLEVIAEGIGPANPAGKFGTWSGGLIRAVLTQIAIAKGGVRNVNVITPAADYEATDDQFPFDAQIHMIVPGAVVVRGAT